MKKLIFILLLIPSIIWGASFNGSANFATGRVEVFLCTTLADSETATGNGAKEGFKFGTQDWWGSPFTATSNYTLCSVEVDMARTATPASYNMTAHIFLDDGGDDITGSSLGNSDSIPASATSTTWGFITFPNMSVSITSGTRYWIMITSDGVDGTNTVSIRTTDLGVAGRIHYDDNGVPPTTVSDATKGTRYKTYE